MEFNIKLGLIFIGIVLGFTATNLVITISDDNIVGIINKRTERTYMTIAVINEKVDTLIAHMPQTKKKGK